MTRLRALMNRPSLTPRRVLSKLKGAAWRLLPGPDVPSTAPARFLEPIGPADPTNPPGPTLVLLNDCRDQVNFGARVLMDGLVAILSRSMPNATMIPIPSHWLMDTSSGFGAFQNDGEGLRQPQATFPTVADQFETIADEWMEGRGGRDAREFLTRLEGADLVVLNGEGSVYRTNLSAIRELFLAWLSKERLRIPTIFVNGTLHLTDVVPVLPAMVRKTFSILDAVAVREAWSVRNLRRYAPDVDAQLFPDSAFVFTTDDARETPAVQAVREQIGESPFFCFDPGAMPMDHRSPEQSALYEMISMLKRVTSRAVFVASAPADGYIREIARETGSVYVDTIADYREYMALVANAQFVVSGRYHNPILAAIMTCPSITFGSANHKVHGACEMLEGLVGSPYDGTHLRPQLDAIEQQARTYVKDRSDLRDRLQEVCHRRRSEALQLGRLAAGELRMDATGRSEQGSAAADR
ncbi:MAG: polysaccharide pyruvyl transferase family protein [Acidimicrobiia bacterium]